MFGWKLPTLYSKVGYKFISDVLFSHGNYLFCFCNNIFIYLWTLIIWIYDLYCFSRVKGSDFNHQPYWMIWKWAGQFTIYNNLLVIYTQKWGTKISFQLLIAPFHFYKGVFYGHSWLLFWKCLDSCQKIWGFLFATFIIFVLYILSINVKFIQIRFIIFFVFISCSYTIK